MGILLNEWNILWDAPGYSFAEHKTTGGYAVFKKPFSQTEEISNKKFSSNSPLECYTAFLDSEAQRKQKAFSNWLIKTGIDPVTGKKGKNEPLT